MVPNPPVGFYEDVMWSSTLVAVTIRVSVSFVLMIESVLNCETATLNRMRNVDLHNETDSLLRIKTDRIAPLGNEMFE